MPAAASFARPAALSVLAITLALPHLSAQTPAHPPANARLEALKTEVSQAVEARHSSTQQMIDMVFSFGELGYQEV